MKINVGLPKLNLPSFDKIKNVSLTQNQKKALLITGLAVVTVATIWVAGAPTLRLLGFTGNDSTPPVPPTEPPVPPKSNTLNANPLESDSESFKKYQKDLTEALNDIATSKADPSKFENCEEIRAMGENSIRGVCVKPNSQKDVDSLFSSLRKDFEGFQSDTVRVCFELAKDGASGLVKIYTRYVGTERIQG